MVSIFASNHEVLIKTEPFLKFKKRLFKNILDRTKINEELLRRKFYKLLDCYLNKREIDASEYKELKLSSIISELDEKFKTKHDGAFVTQGENVGYVEDNSVIWVRHTDDQEDKEIATFL
jgi:hypothetical protein